MKDTLWEQIFLGEDSDGTEIKEETMIRKLRTFALIASCLVVYSQAAFTQGVPSTVLQIDVENFVRYVEDISDPSKFATNPNVTPASVPKNFGAFIAIADIVAVNGQPAKGTFSTRGRVVNLRPAPNPGEAIADTNRNVEEDMRFEILNVDGTAVGTIVGLEVGGGPPPPGAPLAVTQGNNALVGGTGAFFGARGFFGQAVTSQSVPSRMASMAEDPANRRRNGGGKARMVLQVIPMELPQIVVNAGFPQIPLVMHLGDSSLLTAYNPASAAETLRLLATGLGPTKPGVDPGQPFPASPVAAVNSPVTVTVNGKSATVVAAAGVPGAVGRYYVDFQVPSDTAKGYASIQVSAAWIQGSAVGIPIQ